MSDAGVRPIGEPGCCACFVTPLREGLASDDCCIRVCSAFATALTFLVAFLAGIFPAFCMYGEWVAQDTAAIFQPEIDRLSQDNHDLQDTVGELRAPADEQTEQAIALVNEASNLRRSYVTRFAMGKYGAKILSYEDSNIVFALLDRYGEKHAARILTMSNADRQFAWELADERIFDCDEDVFVLQKEHRDTKVLDLTDQQRASLAEFGVVSPEPEAKEEEKS